MKTRRIYSILALILALVMCFSVFTACELDEDDDRGSSGGNKTSSSSAIKAYVYNYGDISELDNYDSPAALDSSKWKSSASFDLSKQWVFSGNGTISGNYGANVIKIENTSSSAMDVSLYFKVSGDISETGDKIGFVSTLFYANGEPLSYGNGYATTYLSDHTSKDSPFVSFTVPANNIRYVVVMQYFGDYELDYDGNENATEAAIEAEFNAKVTLGVFSTKVSYDYTDGVPTSPDYGELETDYIYDTPGDYEYYDMYMNAYVSYYSSGTRAYDEDGNYLFMLYPGENVTITAVSDNYAWARIIYGGKTAYVSLNQLETYEEETTEYWYDTAWETDVEVILPAYSDFASCELYAYVYYEATLYDEYMNYCGYIPAGTTVTVYAVSTDYVWCRVYYQGNYYFIYRDFVDFIEDEESETFDVSYPAYCEYKGRDEYVYVSSYYGSVALYDEMLNPIIYVNGGTELLRHGVSTDPDGTWSAVKYDGEYFYIYSYMLEH